VEGTEDDMPFRSPGEIGLPGLLGGMMGGNTGGAVGPGGVVGPGGPGTVTNPNLPPGAIGPGGNPMMQFQQIFDVRSQFFEVNIDARAGDRTRKYVALLRRFNPRDIRVMYMYWK
jgi:hypothetical protein